MQGYVIGTRTVGEGGRPAGFVHAVSVETRRTMCGVSAKTLTILDDAPWVPTAGVESYCPDCRRRVPLGAHSSVRTPDHHPLSR